MERFPEPTTTGAVSLDDDDAGTEAAPLIEGDDVGCDRRRRVRDVRATRGDGDPHSRTVANDDDARTRARANGGDALVTAIDVDLGRVDAGNVALLDKGDRRIRGRFDERAGEGGIAWGGANTHGGGSRTCQGQGAERCDEDVGREDDMHASRVARSGDERPEIRIRRFALETREAELDAFGR